MPEVDWDRVPGTEITFPHPIDGFAKGVLQYRSHDRDQWFVQVRAGREGFFEGKVQDGLGRWDRVILLIDEPQMGLQLQHEVLLAWHRKRLVTLPMKPSWGEGLAEALNEGLANAARAKRRATGRAERSKDGTGG
jgi:hypothetical protein